MPVKRGFYIRASVPVVDLVKGQTRVTTATARPTATCGGCRCLAPLVSLAAPLGVAPLGGAAKEQSPDSGGGLRLVALDFDFILTPAHLREVVGGLQAEPEIGVGPARFFETDRHFG